MGEGDGEKSEVIAFGREIGFSKCISYYTLLFYNCSIYATICALYCDSARKNRSVQRHYGTGEGMSSQFGFEPLEENSYGI